MKSKIILGTVQFGLKYGINNTDGQIHEAEVIEILDLCKESNISTLDTAAAYGTSEEQIGNYFELGGHAKDFRVITKFSLKNGLSMKDSLNHSLGKLKVDCVDTIMFHNFDDYKNTNTKELDALMEHKGKKFLKLGISLYTNEQMNEVCDLGIFNVIQTPFNALDNHNLRGDTMVKLKEKGIETHTRSVFLQGLFFMNLNSIPSKLKPLGKYLKKLDELTNDFKISKEALALQYVMSRDYIGGVLIGVDSLKQLKTNLESLHLNVPKDVFNAIDSIVVNESELLNPAIWHQ